ncbi:hypothetical protein LOTGIDRAFT_174100 [Lottia gigantea]|uniref:Uncharacterized protein n=1 Tax=Lottia gigantea TaxID=225164 RepID=V4AN94_LOTGI|nr:hypothetical protein LOTGIDRAFT_174100 [Lottia gigantea]ESO98627.1 hypothetical protein LOTGIDRAFT_174100 [Lottia gigantea]
MCTARRTHKRNRLVFINRNGSLDIGHSIIKMQSAQKQCCCCACSVFSALFGIVMVSTGVCLVLNYGLIEIDISGLPPQYQNEEGKKIVGIILICVGLSAMGISAIVSILYYTICSRPKPQISSLDMTSNSECSSSSSNNSTKPKVRPKHKTVQDLKNGARYPSNLAPPQRTKRHKRKPPQYQTRLPTHREEGDVSNLIVTYSDGEAIISQNKNNSNSQQNINQSNLNSASSSDDIHSKQPVIICVDSFPPVTGVTNDAFTDDSLSLTQNTHVEPSDIKTLDDDINHLVA